MCAPKRSKTLTKHWLCKKGSSPVQNACRMRQQLCQIDHSDPITRMPPRRSLVYVLPRVIRLTLCLHLFQVLADALRVNKTITTLYLYGNPFGDEGVKAWWPQRGEFGGPSRSNGSISVVPEFVAVMSLEPLSPSVSMHESRRPSPTPRLILADSLGISFGLGKFPVQQSSALTGSCCRHGSQQDHQSCLFV